MMSTIRGPGLNRREFETLLWIASPEEGFSLPWLPSFGMLARQLGQLGERLPWIRR